MEGFRHTQVPASPYQHHQYDAQLSPDAAGAQNYPNVDLSAWETDIADAADRGHDATGRAERVPLANHHAPGDGVGPRGGLESRLNWLKKTATSTFDTKQSSWKSGRRPHTEASAQEPSWSGAWNPVWLHPAVLAGFAALFLIFLLATGLMYHYSLVNGGLTAQNSVHYIGWKYGPVAVLAIATSFWRLVDYTNKALVPWQELRDGPGPVDRTLLLDYLSPMLPITLWSALRNRHWAIVISVTGYLLLVLATVFSTGLLVLEPTPVVADGVRLATSRIDGTGYNFTNLGPAPIQLYYGIRFQHLAYPPGTTADSLVPTFAPPSDSDDGMTALASANYSAQVRGLRVNFDCEVLPIQNGTIAYLPWYSILSKYFVVNVTTPTCNFSRAIVAAGPNHNFYQNPNATQNYQARIQDYVCNSDIDNSMLDYNVPLDKIINRTADHRILLTVTDLRFDPYSALVTNPLNMWIEQLTAVLCKPSYTVSLYDASFSSDPAISLSRSTTLSRDTNDTIPELYVGDLGLAVNELSKLIYLGDGGSDYVLSTQVPSFFQMMNLINNNSTLKAFMDPALMMKVGSEVFKGIAAQFAQVMLLKTDNNTIVNGTASFIEDRLQVKVVPTAIMCTCFAILVILAILEIFISPRNVVPGAPGSVLAVAAVVRASPDLRHLLLGLGSARQSQIRAVLADRAFSSHLDRATSSIRVTAFPSQEDDPVPTLRLDEQPIEWWRPASTRNWFLALAIGVNLVLIAVLQVIQHISDDQSGFLEIVPGGATVFTSIVPAILAVAVAGMFHSMESAASIFAPFATMRGAKVEASRSVSQSLLTKAGPHVWWLSVQARHLGLTAILLATLIGAFLTMTVSGLYTIIEVPLIAAMDLHQVDAFDLSYTAISLSDNGAGPVNNLIVYNNLPYPQWTYENLAFPMLQPPDPNASATDLAATLDTRVTATRAVLSCTPLPPSTQSFADSGLPVGGVGQPPGTVKIYNDVDGTRLIQSSVKLPVSLCDKPPPAAGNASYVDWQSYFYVRNDSVPLRFGKSSLLAWGLDTDGNLAVDGDGPVPSTGRTLTVGELPAGGYGCPSLAFYVGTASLSSTTQTNHTGNSTKTKTIWTPTAEAGTVVCWQHLQEVETNLTLSYPTFDVVASLNSTPATDEATSRNLQNPVGKYGDKFDFAVNNMLLTLINGTTNATEYVDYDTYMESLSTDSFLWALVDGKDGVPFDQISGPAHTDLLTTQLNMVYGRYMAQVLSLNMRHNGTVTYQPLPTTTSTSSTSSATSKKASTASTGTRSSGSTATPTHSSGSSAAATRSTTSASHSSSSAPQPTAKRAAPLLRSRDGATDNGLPILASELTRTGQNGRHRLQQNAGPKLALQIMLGVMVLCAITMRLLLRFDEVLPHNPCTIAGTASLLVGGALVGEDWESYGSAVGPTDKKKGGYESLGVTEIDAAGGARGEGEYHNAWGTEPKAPPGAAGGGIADGDKGGPPGRWLYSMGWWGTKDGGWTFGIDRFWDDGNGSLRSK